MIVCEHFIYGHFNHVGYRLIVTQDIHQTLTKESLSYLKRLKAKSITQTFLPEENMIAISYFEQTRDEYERDGTWNHTILVNINDYVQLAWNRSLRGVFEPHFIKASKTLGDFKLMPIRIKTK